MLEQPQLASMLSNFCRKATKSRSKNLKSLVTVIHCPRKYEMRVIMNDEWMKNEPNSIFKYYYEEGAFGVMSVLLVFQIVEKNLNQGSDNLL